MTKRVVLSVFKEEKQIIQAAQKVREMGLSIHDAYTPYAVHGLDVAMGLNRSRLPWVTFIVGLTAACLAICFQIWTSAIDWPIIVGGKPFNSFTAFLPVTFEFTVLTAGLSTVAALFYVVGLKPTWRVQTIHPAVTNDRFVLAVDSSHQDAQLEFLLKEFNPDEIKTVEV